MESKRKIVNGETVIACELSVNELGLIYEALNRRFCQLDDRRVHAVSQSTKEYFDECCQKVDRLLDKLYNIMY